MVVLIARAAMLLQLGRVEEAKREYEEVMEDPERGSTATLGLAKVRRGEGRREGRGGEGRGGGERGEGRGEERGWGGQERIRGSDGGS